MKIKAFSLLLACAFLTGCSQNNNTTENNVQKATTVSSTEDKTEITELDPFKDITFTFEDQSLDGLLYYYPARTSIVVSSDDERIATLYEENAIRSQISQANIDTIKIKVYVDENKIKEMKDHGIIPIATEKEFDIPVSNNRTLLISKNQLTSENKELIIENIKSNISEAVPDTNTDFEVVKCYMTETNPNINFIQNGYQAENTMSKTNICKITGSEAFMFYSILKNKDEQYFLAICTPKFTNGIVDTEYLEFRLSTYSPEDTWKPSKYYPSEQLAYDDMSKISSPFSLLEIS